MSRVLSIPLAAEVFVDDIWFPLRVTLVYRTSDPFAVSLHVRTSSTKVTERVIDIRMLATALSGQTVGHSGILLQYGEDDCLVVELLGSELTSELWIPAWAVQEFLQRVDSEVSPEAVAAATDEAFAAFVQNVLLPSK